MAFRKLLFMAHGRPTGYVSGVFVGSIGLVFLLGLLCAHYIFARLRKASKGFVSEFIMVSGLYRLALKNYKKFFEGFSKVMEGVS